jgi:hypothetical protein
MKTAIGAIQGMPTYELLEVADTVWAAQRSHQRTAAELGKARDWQLALAEAAEQLRQQQKQALRRRGNWFKRLWDWLKSSLGGIEHSCPRVQPAGNAASGSAVQAEQSTQASPPGAIESSQAEREETQTPQAEINLKNLNPHVRKFVGQTIVGRVSLEMVLAELERRGYPYRPPIKEDGTLVIRECDLTNGICCR